MRDEDDLERRKSECILQAFQDEDQIKRAVLFVKVEMARYSYMGEAPGSGLAPGGVEPRDIVIDCLLEASKKWEPHRASIWTFVRWRARQEVWELATCAENRCTRRFNPDENPEESPHFGVSRVHVQPDQEEKIFFNETASFMRALTAADKDDRKVAEAMLQGHTKPGEIATETGLPLTRVESIHRRLSRRFAAHWTTYSHLMPKGKGDH